MANNKKKFVKVNTKFSGETVYRLKECRPSLQATYIKIVLARYGINGKQYIDLATLKALRAEAERVHHNREWDGKMFNGALSALVDTLFAKPHQEEGPGTKVLGCTVNLEGLDVFMKTGLNPEHYEFYTRDQVQILDSVPEGFVRDPIGQERGAFARFKGWVTPETAAKNQEWLRRAKI